MDFTKDDDSKEEFNKVDYLENDYCLSQIDIRQAKIIEPYYDLFKIFNKKNIQIVTLCLAGIRTLIRDTDGVFSKDEMNEALSHLSQKTRNRIFNELQENGWIINNGLRYEIPERVRMLTLFLHTVLTFEEQDFNQLIELSCAMTDIDEIACTDEEVLDNNFEGAMGTLKHIRAQLKRALEQKSSIAAREILNKSKDIGIAFDAVEKRLKDSNRKKYRYSLTTQIMDIRADIINMNQSIFEFIHQDIQANARSFGQYLTPEQVDEFLHKASQELLANMVKKRFSSPRKSYWVSKDEILRRGLAYLHEKPETEMLTIAPPVVEIKQRDVLIQREENDTIEYYRELIYRLNKNSELTLNDAVIKVTFGKSLYRTGLLVTIRNEVTENSDKPQIDLIGKGVIVDIKDGPLDKISDGVVKLKDTNKNI